MSTALGWHVTLYRTNYLNKNLITL